MTSIITKTDSAQPAAARAVDLFDTWFDPIETSVRERVHDFIEELIRGELDAVLARPRYGRQTKPGAGTDVTAGVIGYRHGRRTRSLLGTFGKTEITVPRARLETADGKTREWKSSALRAYQRRTQAADALIAGSYLAGTNTRRVRRALAAVFAGAIGKDVVSRVWRKVKSDWDAWNARSLATEPIVRLILDGTVVRVRLDRKSTSISLLVVIGVREDGQKVLLAIKSMGGESTEAWRAVLDDMVKRGLRRPDFLIIDGAPGLEQALAAVWDGVPLQRCTVHKHRNLLAHAPERLHDEITADYTDMIYAATPEEIALRRRAFIRGCGVLSLRHSRLARWCSLSLGGWWPKNPARRILAWAARCCSTRLGPMVRPPAAPSISTLVIFRFGATMELGRSERTTMRPLWSYGVDGANTPDRKPR